MNETFLSSKKIIITFLIFSAVWIISSNYILPQLAGHGMPSNTYLQVVKDLLFAGILTIIAVVLFKRNQQSKMEHSVVSTFSNKDIDIILSDINMGISRFDAEDKFTYVNDTFCKIAGYPAEVLLGKPYTFLIRGKDNIELDYWSTMIRQDKLNKMSNLVGIANKDNHVIICNAFLNRLVDDKGVPFFVLMIEDISQKIAGDKTLEENLTRYTILGKATVEGLCDWNIKTGQFYYNANIKALFGFDHEELKQGFEWWKANIHPDDKEKILDKIDAAFKLKHITSLNNEYRFACKDGSYKIIADCFSIMRTSEGIPFRFIVSMQDFTDQRNLQRELADKESIYRRQLARTVMDTQESERRKLAEELHDNVNQLLGVVKLYIEHSITNENVREGLLKKSSDYIDKVIEELRNLSKNLSPPLLAELGLEHSINSLADAISNVQHITVTIDMLDFNEEDLMESHKLMIYRIIQEQLNNIIKHAEAQNVEVDITKTGEKVQLTITDDGKGVDLSVENNEGSGLRNIRNRIELYHGSIEMISSPGNGFILKVSFDV